MITGRMVPASKSIVVWLRGGMVDALVLGTSIFGCVGSSPTGATQGTLIQWFVEGVQSEDRETGILFHSQRMVPNRMSEEYATGIQCPSTRIGIWIKLKP